MSSSRNSEINWKIIGKMVSDKHTEYHSKAINMSSKKRLEGIHTFFVSILDFVWHNDEDKIMEYIEKRKKTNERLQMIQDDMLDEITEMLKPIKPIAGSSFTAGTNIIGESDLDFNIPVPDMDQKKLLKIAVECGKYGYEFADIRNADSEDGVNYVFSKWVEDSVLGKVEIEVKLNHAIPYMKVMDKVHTYLDHRMPARHKHSIAWIKQHFKKLQKSNNASKHNYKLFKSLYYEHALFPMGITEMLYPLQ
jgi:hypothetical protein